MMGNPDKYLLNTYLLNPMLGKDGIRPWISLPILAKFSTGRVGRKSIRSTNAHDKGQMIYPSGTFGGVCDTPLPKPDKCLLNTYLLNPIAGKDGYVWNLLNQKPDTFGDVCDTPLP